MNSRYTYSEILNLDFNSYSSLNVSENRNHLLGIFRLLTGTVNCLDEYLSKTYKFRTNYFQFPFQPDQRLNKSILLNQFENEVELSDLNDYFRVERRNKLFYEIIECELLNCLIANKQQNYSLAFLYLYRIIEGISYSLPLIYASKSKDYNKSFELFQKLFNGVKDGELGIFKKFIEEIYKNEDFFNSTINIKLDLIEIEELKEKYYKIYTSIIIKKDTIIDFTEYEELKISFLGYFEFLIGIRNKYFHFLQGIKKDNIRTMDVLYPEMFFKPIIDNGINWVSIILFEIMKNDLK